MKQRKASGKPNRVRRHYRLPAFLCVLLKKTATKENLTETRIVEDALRAAFAVKRN